MMTEKVISSLGSPEMRFRGHWRGINSCDLRWGEERFALVSSLCSEKNLLDRCFAITACWPASLWVNIEPMVLFPLLCLEVHPPHCRSVPSTAQVDWNKRKLSHISFFLFGGVCWVFFPVAHLGKVLWSLGAKCSMCSTSPLWEWCLGGAACPSWGISALLQTGSTDSHATKI